MAPSRGANRCRGRLSLWPNKLNPNLYRILALSLVITSYILFKVLSNLKKTLQLFL